MERLALDDIRARITKDGIRIYEDADFAGMRLAGRVAAEILDAVAHLVVPGATTAVIDDFITAEIARRGVTSATVGYKGYKHASCISVNHVVCHGIPGPKVLVDGDILNVDVTVIVDGWYGDTSRMYVAGQLARKAERLALRVFPEPPRKAGLPLSEKIRRAPRPPARNHKKRQRA